jgi:hypothetical protein
MAKNDCTTSSLATDAILVHAMETVQRLVFVGIQRGIKFDM